MCSNQGVKTSEVALGAGCRGTQIGTHLLRVKTVKTPKVALGADRSGTQIGTHLKIDLFHFQGQ